MSPYLTVCLDLIGPEYLIDPETYNLVLKRENLRN